MQKASFLKQKGCLLRCDRCWSKIVSKYGVSATVCKLHFAMPNYIFLKLRRSTGDAIVM